MTIKIAINGYGRIGKNILRVLYETNKYNLDQIQVVAINDLGDPRSLAHLTKYDSIHGKFKYSVVCEDGYLIIDNKQTKKIQALSIADPTQLPWKELNVDLVLECTGLFTKGRQAQKHVEAGAKKVLISAPASREFKTIVYGINHNDVRAHDQIVASASCTTNCLAPLAWVLNKELKIISGLITTVHSYTNDQVLLDVFNEDLRRARSATSSIIPTKTGAANALGLIIPELNNKLDGFALRVPTANVSVVDLSVIVEKKHTVTEINDILRSAVKNELSEIAAVNELPLVSIDFNHNNASSIFDLTQTKVSGKLIKVLSWYDNEWAFANRMLDLAFFMGNIK